MSNLKNLVPCCIKVFKQKPDSEGYYIEPTKNQMIDKLLEQHDKLTKYKRAFEILKSKEIFEFKDDNCLYLNAEDHNWWGDIIESSFVRLSDEEYELLEELMKSEI